MQHTNCEFNIRVVNIVSGWFKLNHPVTLKEMSQSTQLMNTRGEHPIQIGTEIIILVPKLKVRNSNIILTPRVVAAT